MPRATGSFEVNIAPVGEPDVTGASTLGRASVEKQYHGELEGAGRGQMLTAMTAVEGSAGYVALERFVGRLGGRSGSFVLQHSGMMRGEQAHLDLVVLPDSADGELRGLTGHMQIVVEEGRHSYTLEYKFPADPTPPASPVA